MKAKLSDEFRRALKIIGIILIVSALILIILSGIHESPWQEEQTVTITSNNSSGIEVNIDQDRSVKLKYNVIEGPDTIRIIVLIEDFNNEFVNLTETNGRELLFTSDGDNNYRLRFYNYGNESTTIHYNIFVSAYMGNIGYFYLAVICFISSAILLITSSLKNKNIDEKHKKD